MIMKNRLSEDAFRSSQAPRKRAPAGGGLGMGPAAKYFETFEEKIADHPGLSLTAALLVGVLVAWWIKRR
jgi:hypothetical protein